MGSFPGFLRWHGEGWNYLPPSSLLADARAGNSGAADVPPLCSPGCDWRVFQSSPASLYRDLFCFLPPRQTGWSCCSSARVQWLKHWAATGGGNTTDFSPPLTSHLTKHHSQELTELGFRVAQYQTQFAFLVYQTELCMVPVEVRYSAIIALIYNLLTIISYIYRLIPSTLYKRATVSAQV